MGKSKFVGFKVSDILEATKKPTNNYQTSMFWYPGVEKDKTSAEYIIRFVPNYHSTLGINYVQRNSHMINFPNGNRLNEPCPKCIVNKWECPICEVVRPWFKSDNLREKNMALKQYAIPQFFSIIYVVSDPRDEHANEGKLFIYKYGKKIHAKCQQILEGDPEENEEGLVHFDLLTGANFKIIVNKVVDQDGKSQPNYDESRFVRKNKPLVLANGEEITEDDVDAFLEKSPNMNDYILADKYFKSYDELKSLYENRGSDTPFDKEKPATKSEEPKKKVSNDDDDDNGPAPVKKTVTEAPKKTVTVEKEVAEKPKTSDDDDDLAKLLADDE